MSLPSSKACSNHLWRRTFLVMALVPPKADLLHTAMPMFGVQGRSAGWLGDYEAAADG